MKIWQNLVVLLCLMSLVAQFRLQLTPSTATMKMSGLSQSNLTIVAHIFVEHSCCQDLLIDLGVGDPQKPDWLINIWNRETVEGVNLSLTIDISEANEFLPPSEANVWFLRVYDATAGNIGEISQFAIELHNEIFASTCVPVAISDFQTSLSYIPGVTLELAISRRVSIRDFPDTQNYTLPNIPWKILSKVLWAGYGRSSWGRTVPSICGSYPLVIYVCNQTACYKYNPQANSLEPWKEGDYRFSPRKWDRHRAPIELFIGLDMNECADISLAAMEAGCVVQNIYLEANSLDLGTVCVGGVDPEAAHEDLDLPPNEYVLYNMPLGHPEPNAFYSFSSINVAYPPRSAELPQVRQGHVLLDYALMERKTASNWRETPLTPQEVSQILWSAYGFSYLKDMRPSFPIYGRQHRTVPSAHGLYPLTIWMANSSGIFAYAPYSHRTLVRIEGDRRAEIANAAGANRMAAVPAMLVVVWNSTKLERQDWAYTEIGCTIQNVHLESIAWGLAVDWDRIDDEDAVRTVLGLDEQKDLHPVVVIGVGHPIAYRHRVVWDGMAYTLSVSTNSSATNFAFDQQAKTESFEIIGGNATNGFCNVTIPREIIRGDCAVLIDGTTTGYILAENDTHKCLYFTYSHAIRHVQIIATPVHDLATVDIIPSSTKATVGDLVNIDVVVRNEGTEREVFNVTLFCDSSAVETRMVSLDSQDDTALTFVWNTAGVTPGYYSLRAETSVVPEETETEDNSRISNFTIELSDQYQTWWFLLAAATVITLAAASIVVIRRKVQSKRRHDTRNA